MERINRITIYDGESNLTEIEIEKDPKLIEIRDVMINREHIEPFIKRINKERGTLTINVDKDRNLLKIDLIDVSASLYFAFMNR